MSRSYVHRVVAEVEVEVIVAAATTVVVVVVVGSSSGKR